MSSFPAVDRLIFEKSPRVAALLYLAVTGSVSKYCIKNGQSIFTDLDTGSAETMRALLLALARPYRNPRTNADPKFLQKLIEARDFPLPPGNALLSFPLRVFDTLRDLRAHLADTHQPKYWYRGQNTQHVAVYEGFVNALTIFDPAVPTDDLVALDPPGTVRLALDSLLPSFYRSAASGIPADWTAVDYDIPPLDYVTAPARAIMAAPCGHPIRTLLLKFLEDVARPALLAAVRRGGGLPIRDPEAEARALPYTNVQQSELNLISLAQHYGHGSVMVDITRSIDVALWFAAFGWNDDALIGRTSDDFGVVYRFDADAINPLIKTNFCHDEDNRPPVPHFGLFGMADISTMDAEIAIRPRVQQGGSLLGFENSVMHLLLSGGQHVQAFAFPHRSADGNETPFRKSDLCPVQDPALEVFRPGDTNSGPIMPDELDRFLRECGADDELRKQIVHQRNLRAV